MAHAGGWDELEDVHKLGDLSGIVDGELEGFIEGVRAEFGEVSGF